MYEVTSPNKKKYNEANLNYDWFASVKFHLQEYKSMWNQRQFFWDGLTGDKRILTYDMWINMKTNTELSEISFVTFQIQLILILMLEKWTYEKAEISIDSERDEKLDKAPGITCFLLVRLSAFHHANISGRGEM